LRVDTPLSYDHLFLLSLASSSPCTISHPSPALLPCLMMIRPGLDSILEGQG
ncbi:unnamed protein product, partial [Brassica oleracea]